MSGKTQRCVLHIRVSAEQLEAYQLAAEIEGSDLSASVRAQLDRWAERTIRSEAVDRG